MAHTAPLPQHAVVDSRLSPGGGAGAGAARYQRAPLRRAERRWPEMARLGCWYSAGKGTPEWVGFQHISHVGHIPEFHPSLRALQFWLTRRSIFVRRPSTRRSMTPCHTCGCPFSTTPPRLSAYGASPVLQQTWSFPSLMCDDARWLRGSPCRTTLGDVLCARS